MSKDVVTEHAVSMSRTRVGKAGDFAVAVRQRMDYWIDGLMGGDEDGVDGLAARWRIFRPSVPGTGQTGATGGRGRKDCASGAGQILRVVWDFGFRMW